MAINNLKSIASISIFSLILLVVSCVMVFNPVVVWGQSSGQVQLDPPGSQDPGLVDLKTGKVQYSQPLMSLGSSTSPGYSVSLDYSTLGHYTNVTTWNIENQSVEAGLGWSAPALHQRIIRNNKSTGVTWDDEFLLQQGGSAVPLTLINVEKDENDNVLSKTYTTISDDWSKITWYPSPTDTTPDDYVASQGKHSYQPSYWEVINTSGAIYRYGAYTLTKPNGKPMNIFQQLNDPHVPNQPLDPYKVYDSQSPETKNSDADLIGGVSSAICESVYSGNNNATTGDDRNVASLLVDGTFYKPDSCNYLPVEWGVSWNAWYGDSGSTEGQTRFESAWNLAEIESPINGYATTLSYVCHTQQVGRTTDDEGKYILPNDKAKTYTLGCYLYQVAGTDGSILSLKYQNAAFGAEVIDNHMEDYEPDGYQEQYRVLSLTGVDRYEDGGADIPIKLGRAIIDYGAPLMGLGGNMQKSVIRNVSFFSETPGRSSNSTQIEPSVLFDYYDNNNSETSVSIDRDNIFNNGMLFGALKSVTNANGLTFNFSYEQNDVSKIFNETFTIDSSGEINGQHVPHKEIYPFWGPNYLVLIGAGYTDDQQTLGTVLAVFTHSSKGWKFSKSIIVSPDQTAPGGFSHGPTIMKASWYSRMVATATDYFVYMEPTSDGTGGAHCAKIWVVSKKRDAAGGTDDWENAVQLKNTDNVNSSQYCTANLVTFYAECTWEDIWGNFHPADCPTKHQCLRNTSYSRLPSIDVNDQIVAVVGSQESDASNNHLTIWRTKDNWQQTPSVIVESDMDNSRKDMPVAIAVGPNNISAYGIDMTGPSVHDNGAEKATVFAYYVPLDELGNATSEVVKTIDATYNVYTNKSNNEVGQVRCLMGFSPLMIIPTYVGGFPTAEIIGTKSFLRFDEKHINNDTCYTTDNHWVGPEFLSTLVYANNRDTFSNIVIIYNHTSVDLLPKQPLQHIIRTGELNLDDNYDTFSEEQGHSSAFTQTFAIENAAITSSGILWSSYSLKSFKWATSAGHYEVSNTIGCRYESLEYDGSKWEMKWYTLPGWDFTHPNQSGNSCTPGGTFASKVNNNYQTSATATNEGIFTTLGHDLYMKYFSYAPLGDKNGNDGYTDSTDYSKLHLGNPGATYAEEQSDFPPKVTLSKSAKRWLEAESIINQIMNVGFMTAMLMPPVSLLDGMLIAWQIGSTKLNNWSMTQYDTHGGSSAFFSTGRYMQDGEQVHYIDHNGALDIDSGTDVIVSLLKDYDEKPVVKYSGVQNNFIIFPNTIDGSEEKKTYFGRFKNGTLRTYSDSGYLLQEFDTAGSSENAFRTYYTPDEPGLDCDNTDCGQTVTYNQFLTYQPIDNHKSLSAQNPVSAGSDFNFSLHRLQKDRVVDIYDYAVSKVVVDDGYNEYTTSYIYPDTEDPDTDVNFSGVTAIYPNVRVVRGADTTSVEGNAYTEYNFYSGNRNDPQVWVQEEDESLPTRKDATEVMGYVLGKAYSVKQYRADDGKVVQQTDNEHLVLDIGQKDEDNNSLSARRGTLTQSTTATYDDEATTTTDYTYNVYHQVDSSTTTRDRFEHTAIGGSPAFYPNNPDAGPVSVTTTTKTKYAYEVQVSDSDIQQKYSDLGHNGSNRLNEIYLQQTEIAEGDSPNSAYVKGASAMIYEDWLPPVGDAANDDYVFIPDKSYSFIPSDIDPITFASYIRPIDVENPDNSKYWLAGPTILKRDEVTPAPIEVQAPTQELAASQVAYFGDASASSPYTAYQFRYKYASFVGVKLPDKNGNTTSQAAYVGFEEYESANFDEDIVDDSSCQSDYGVDVNAGLYNSSIIANEANTGWGYCRMDSDGVGTSDVRYTTEFVPNPDVDYVLSAWVNPCGNLPISIPCPVNCEILHGDGSHNSTLDYDQTNYYTNGSRWFYLEATMSPSQMPVANTALLSCSTTGANYETYIDDIRFAPINSSFGATVYDTEPSSETYMLATSTHTDNGNVVRAMYDDYRRSYLTLLQDTTKPQDVPKFLHMGDSTPVSQIEGITILSGFESTGGISSGGGFSRWGGYNLIDVNGEVDDFKPAIPNSSMLIGTRGTNTLQFHETMPHSNSAQTFRIEAEETDQFMMRFTTASSDTIELVWLQGNDILGQLVFDQTDSKVKFTPENIQTSIEIGSYPANHLPYEICIAVHRSNVVVFGDGNLIGSYYGSPSDSHVVSSESIFIENIDTSTTINNVLLAPLAGSIATSYLDAAGRSIESHVLSGYWGKDDNDPPSPDQFHFTDLVSATYYDGWGRAAVQTKAVEYTDPSDSTNRDFNPDNPTSTRPVKKEPLLAFRGISQKGGSDRNFAIIDWSTGSAITEAHTFHVDVACVAPAAPAYDFLINNNVKASGTLEMSNSTDSLIWKELTLAFDQPEINRLKFDIHPVGNPTNTHVYIRNIRVDGVVVDLDGGYALASADNSEKCCLAYHPNPDATNNYGCPNNAQGMSSYCANTHVVTLDAKPAVYLGSASGQPELEDARNQLLIQADFYINAQASSGELVDFYSNSKPGQEFYGNADTDAPFALVSSIAYDSPLARTDTTTVQPGEEFSQDGDGTNPVLTMKNTYQKDNLSFISDTGLASFTSDIHYADSSKAFPMGNKAYSFGVTDMLGHGVVAAKSWSKTGDPTDLDKTIWSGSVYSFSDSNQGQSNISSSESRQPVWYNEMEKEDPTYFTERSWHYDNVGLWSEGQGSDAANAHVFTDDSGRARLTVVGVDFAQSLDTQIASYIKKDDIGRTVETGRLKGVSYTADIWEEQARKVGIDDTFLDPASENTCNVGEIKYDSNPDIVADDGTQYTRGRVAQSTRVNREVGRVDGIGWDDKALIKRDDPQPDDCDWRNYETSNVSSVTTSYVYDAFGRITIEKNTIREYDTSVSTQEYKLEYYYPDSGNYTNIIYPADANGTDQGTVTYTVDRLGRQFSVTDTLKDNETPTSWQLGDTQLGMVTSELLADGVYRFTHYNFQGQVTQICQTKDPGDTTCENDGVTSGEETKLIYREDLRYPKDVATEKDVDDVTPYATCNSLGTTQYSENELAYTRTSGSGYYGYSGLDDDPTEDAEVAQCYSYNGMGWLEAVHSFDVSNVNGVDIAEEGFGYDNNGNMEFSAVSDAITEEFEEDVFLEPTVDYTNNQLNLVHYKENELFNGVPIKLFVFPGKSLEFFFDIADHEIFPNGVVQTIWYSGVGDIGLNVIYPNFDVCETNGSEIDLDCIFPTHEGRFNVTVTNYGSEIVTLDLVAMWGDLGMDDVGFSWYGFPFSDHINHWWNARGNGGGDVYANGRPKGIEETFILDKYDSIPSHCILDGDRITINTGFDPVGNSYYYLRVQGEYSNNFGTFRNVQAHYQTVDPILSVFTIHANTDDHNQCISDGDYVFIEYEDVEGDYCFYVTSEFPVPDLNLVLTEKNPSDHFCAGWDGTYRRTYFYINGKDNSNLLENGVPQTITATAGEQVYHSLIIPPNAKNLKISVTDVDGAGVNPDLYVKAVSHVDIDGGVWDCAPQKGPGEEEYCPGPTASDTYPNPEAGFWYIAVDAKTDIDVTITAEWELMSEEVSFETGTFTADNTWKTVQLDHTYVSPVVVCSLNLTDTTYPAMVRVKNAGLNSFDVRLQNPGDSQTLTPMPVHYFVIEEGAWTLPDGRYIEAQKVLSDDTNYKNGWQSSRMEELTYQHTYTQPVVLGQVMTENDPDWSVFWSSDGTHKNPPSATSCFVGKNVVEDSDTTRDDETLGVIVVEAGNGVIDGVHYTVGIGSDSIRGVKNKPPYVYDISAAGFTANPQIGIVSSAGMDGQSGAWPVLYGVTPITATNLNLAVDEAIGSNRKHITEQIAYLVWQTAINGPDGSNVLNNGEPKTISASAGEQVYHSLAIPSNAKNLKISVTDVDGAGVDPDLYVKAGSHVDIDGGVWDCAPQKGPGEEEYCPGPAASDTYPNPEAGFWHIVVDAKTEINCTITAEWTTIEANNVGLLGAHDKWLVSEQNGGGDVNANRDNQGSWETFNLHLVVDPNEDYCISDGDTIAIDTGSGGGWPNSNYFLGTDANGGLFANDQVIGAEERFTIHNWTRNTCIQDDDIISLQSTQSGLYMVAEDDGDALVDRVDSGPWEKFRINMGL